MRNQCLNAELASGLADSCETDGQWSLNRLETQKSFGGVFLRSG